MPVPKDHARHLADAEIAAMQTAAWTCLVCQAVNDGPLSGGCQVCGSGAASARRADADQVVRPIVGVRVVDNSGTPPMWTGWTSYPPAQGLDQQALAAAALWLQQHPQSGVVDTFLAGYRAASLDLRNGMVEHRAVTPTPAAPELTEPDRKPPAPAPAPFPIPSSPEVGSLAPEGKAARTILAALRYFRDQVLLDGPDLVGEIAEGVWCSAEEAEALIAHLQNEESHV